MGTLNVDGCSFLFNEAGRSGGAVHCEFIKTVTIKSSAFIGNVKTDDNCSIQDRGGAVMVWNLNVSDGYTIMGVLTFVGDFIFEDCFFHGNKVISPDCLGMNELILCVLNVFI
jgi:hypothetical protein